MYLSKKISTFITDAMMENSEIDKRYEEVYAYCFEYFLDSLQYILLTLLIACIFHRPGIGIIYIITLMPAKYLAGGSHAPTPVCCEILSYSAVLFILFGTKPLIAHTAIPWPVIFCTAIPLIMLLAPVDTKNKRYSVEKKRRMKKYCILFLLLLSLIFGILYYYHLKYYYGTLTICVMIILADQLTGTALNISVTHQQA